MGQEATVSVRPKDLLEEKARDTALHCGECVVDYPAIAELYDWMFPDDFICCVACGAELVVEKKVMVEA